MTDNEIFQLAEKFRSAILRENANGEFFRDGFNDNEGIWTFLC